jgi:hypothetical protein
MDDNHHPVPITKNNFGSLTFRDFSDFSSQLREDFQPSTRIRLTPFHGLAVRLERFTRSHPRF